MELILQPCFITIVFWLGALWLKYMINAVKIMLLTIIFYVILRKNKQKYRSSLIFHWCIEFRRDLSSIILYFTYIRNLKISITLFKTYTFMLYNIFWLIILIENIHSDFIKKQSIAFCILLKAKFKIQNS